MLPSENSCTDVKGLRTVTQSPAQPLTPTKHLFLSVNHVFVD